MIKAISALAGMADVKTGHELQLRDLRGRGLWQIDAWHSSDAQVRELLSQHCGLDIAAQSGAAVVQGESRLMWAGPARYWLVLERDSDKPQQIEAQLDAEVGHIIDLSHSRTVIQLQGEAAQAVLQSGIAVDLDAQVFKPGKVMLTALAHHTPVTLHRLGDQHFELYVYRSYAQHTMEWLLEVAKPFGVDWVA